MLHLQRRILRDGRERVVQPMRIRHVLCCRCNVCAVVRRVAHLPGGPGTDVGRHADDGSRMLGMRGWYELVGCERRRAVCCCDDVHGQRVGVHEADGDVGPRVLYASGAVLVWSVHVRGADDHKRPRVQGLQGVRFVGIRVDRAGRLVGPRVRCMSRRPRVRWQRNHDTVRRWLLRGPGCRQLQCLQRGLRVIIGECVVRALRCGLFCGSWERCVHTVREWYVFGGHCEQLHALADVCTRRRQDG